MLAYRKCAGAPWATAMNFRQVGQLGEDGLISQRDVYDSMVSERAHGRDDGGFLTASQGTGRYENTGVLAPIRSGLPLLTRRVPERFPLRREIPVTGRNAEEKSVVLGEDTGADEGDVRRLARGVHLGKDLLRESFLHPAKILVRSHVKSKERQLSAQGNCCFRAEE